MSLPPVVKGYLFYDGVWNDVSNKMRQTKSISIDRGSDSESGTNSPTKASLIMDNRSGDFSPRNPESPLFDKIGRNTPMKIVIEQGPPYLEIPEEGLFNDSAIVAVNQSQINFTSDVDIRIDCTSSWWHAYDFAFGVMLAERYNQTGENRSFKFARHRTGVLYFGWSSDGTFAGMKHSYSTDTIPFFNGERVALRVTLDVNNGKGGYTVRFYYSNQIDGEWVELGQPTETTSGTTSIFNGTASLWVGAPDDGNLPDGTGTTFQLNGKVFAYQHMDGINGPVKLDLDVARDAVVTDTSIVDGTGASWSLQEDAVFKNEYVRISGEVPSWPPNRDLSGNNKDSEIEPTGIMRRLDAGNKPLESALLRYIRANPIQPVECWPLIDGAQSNGGGSIIDGGQPMVVRIENLTSGLYEVANERYGWAEGTLAKWIEPVGVPTSDTNGYITGECRDSATAASKWSFDMFVSGINTDNVTFQAIDRTVPTVTDAAVIWNIEINKGSDAVDLLAATVAEGGSSISLLKHMTAPGIFDGKPHHLRLTVYPGASPTDYEFWIDGVLIETGSFAVPSMQLLRIRANWFLDSANEDGFPFGFLTYWDANGPSAAEVYEAFSGFPGEKSGARFNRLMNEQGLMPSLFTKGGAGGEPQFQEEMGIQGLKKFLELLQQCASSDVSIFGEMREEGNLYMRHRSMLYNQAPRFTLDFSNGVISAPFKPLDDDKLTENDVVVQRDGGSFSRQVLEEGRMSIQDPPDGVGRYDVSKTLSLFEDSQTDNLAYWFLHMGTFDGLRYTRLTVDLANPRVYEMVHKILNTDLGDVIRLTNLPKEYGPDDVDLMVRGYTEEIGPQSWTITFNCSPGLTWTTASAVLDIYEGFEDSSYNINIANGGSASWAVNTSQFHSGPSSFKSGAISNNQNSDAIVTVPKGAEKIEFWYKTDSEASGPGFNGDRLIVLVDAATVLTAQGPAQPWMVFSADVSSASTVTFRYSKDNSGAVGADAAWIDDLRFRITSPFGGNADTSGSVTTESLTTTETGMDVSTTTGARWATGAVYPNDFPFDVRVGGEVMTVTDIEDGLEDDFTRSVAPTITDTFTRTTANGWGSADTGQAWTTSGGVAADYSTTGTVGQVSVGVVNSSRFTQVPTVSLADVDMQADNSVPVTATGASISCGLRLRAIDTNNYYYIEQIRSTAGTTSIQLVSRVAGVSTTIAGPVSKGAYSASQLWTIRARLVGDVLQAKLWATAGAEPDAWDVSAVTTTLTASNPVGTRCILSTGNTNTLPVVYTWDNIRVSPVSQGWGTSTSGDAWTTSGGSASNYFVSDGEGIVELTSVNSSRRCLVGPNWLDVDVQCSVQVPVVALTDSIDPGILARYTSSSDYYLGTLHFHNDATVDVRIRKVVGGVFTTIGISDLIPGTYGPGSRYWMRFYCKGSDLRAKGWAVGTTEPETWNITAVDTDLTDPGDVGVRSNLQINNTNTLPVMLAYDDFEVLSPQQFTVVRSVNGVVKTHSSGAKVELAKTPIAPL